MRYLKYAADILTWSRLALVIPILVAGVTRHWAAAALMVAIAIVTDIFDGPLARTWPYSPEENATLWWRKDAHAFDNIGDGLAYYAAVFVLMFHSVLWIIAAVIGGVISAGFIVAVKRLQPTHPRAAEIIDVIYGWFYGISFGVIILGLVHNWNPGYVLGFGIALAFAGIGIAAFKWDRATTRPETNPERYAVTTV